MPTADRVPTVSQRVPIGTHSDRVPGPPPLRGRDAVDEYRARPLTASHTPTIHQEHPMRILAIDPGNTESGWCVIDTNDCRPLEFGKTENRELLEMLQLAPISCEHICIEMIASYGMAVGAEVFETCVWIGRFYETVQAPVTVVELVKRHPVKLHHCHSSKATDATVRQALVDRFAKGQPNHGKGTKTAPGWFYGFRADIWQAYALAVYAADQLDPTQAAPVQQAQAPMPERTAS